MKHKSMTYNLASPWEPVVILPSQVCDRSACTRSPEIALVVAMIEDALQCILRNTGALHGRHRREFVDACNWVCSDRRDWPFAFANVCDMLGLDAAAVRQSVQRQLARACKADTPADAAILRYFASPHDRESVGSAPVEEELSP